MFERSTSRVQQVGGDVNLFDAGPVLLSLWGDPGTHLNGGVTVRRGGVCFEGAKRITLDLRAGFAWFCIHMGGVCYVRNC
ncbi:hypothetical protein LCGC14_2422870 [marine sediment metagenome]|uniref:Uncharacterized protein n=1 Tax=marine sediment metagenome TaxID=412755 RepID=A0A0F9E172_9ZZZZ